ncbi:acyltransferase family protein [Nocardioides sp.]|uniref:acyltransferase family protein n=1 Tax=Nocardioides sp. TaxID=35761 RepID=UPI0035163640
MGHGNDGTRGGARARVAYLDGIRGAAILAVLGVHWVVPYAPIGGGGYLAVDVFFVLSGFIITTVLWRSRGTGTVRAQWTAFTRNRVRRLYPPLLALIVVAPIATALLPFSDVGVGTALKNSGLALVQLTWLSEAMDVMADPLRQTWSLAIEWYFYLLWPIAVFAARRAGWTPRRLAAWSLGVAAVLYASMLPWDGLIFYFTPPGRFAEILVGAALALIAIEHGGVLPRRRWVEIASLVTMGLTAVYMLVTDWHYSEPIVRFAGAPFAVAMTVLILCAGQHEGPTRWLLTRPPLTAVGRCSYSLYLWHWLPVFLMDKDKMDLPGPVLGVIGVTAAIALTWLSYRFLELPFLGSQAKNLAPQAAGAPPRDTPAPARSAAEQH